MSVQLHFYPTKENSSSSTFGEQQQQEKQGQQSSEKHPTSSTTNSNRRNTLSAGHRFFSSSAGGGQQQSPQKQHKTPTSPLVTVPTGAVKRKLHHQQPNISTTEMDIPEMSSTGQFASASTAELPDLFGAPQPKQRRYEERMSQHFGNIHISPEKPDRPNGQQPQRSGPKIEEILDWDEELLDEDVDNLLQEAASVPIVEEPCTTPTMEEEREQARTARKQQADKKADKIRIEELEPGDEEEDIEIDAINEHQKIVLSEELRQLIQEDRRRAETGQQSLLGMNNGKTGKELIPYIPSPLAARLPTGNGTFHVEELKQDGNGVEEVFDGEVLPDAANSPEIQSDASTAGDSLPPTPSPTDAAHSSAEEEEEEKLRFGHQTRRDEMRLEEGEEQQQEEEAMEMD